MPCFAAKALGRHQRAEHRIEADGAEAGTRRGDGPAAPRAADIEQKLATAAHWKLRNRDCIAGRQVAIAEPIGQRHEAPDHRLGGIAAGHDLAADLLLQFLAQVDGVDQVDGQALPRHVGELDGARRAAMGRRQVGAQQHRNAVDDRVIRPIAGDEAARGKGQRLTLNRVDETIAQPILHPA